MNGGYFIGPNSRGKAKGYGGRKVWAMAKSIDDLLSAPGGAKGLTPAQMRGYVARWRPAAVVAVTYRTSRLGRLLTTVFGPPSFATGRVVVWRR
jgi:hypothetical protein